MKKKKLLLRGLAVLLLVILAGVGFGGNYLVNYAIVRKDEAQDVAPDSVVTEENQRIIAENRKMIEAQKEEWLASAERQEAQIESEDRLLLKGDVFWTDHDSHSWVIAVHGYGGERSGMYNIASFYSLHGYILNKISHPVRISAYSVHYISDRLLLYIAYRQILNLVIYPFLKITRQTRSCHRRKAHSKDIHNRPCKRA